MGLKRSRSALLVVCAALFLPMSTGARQVEITILHTADLRGQVLSLRYREHNRYLGGLLRTATVIAQIRAEQPNVLLIDCGDLLTGSPEGALTDGTLALEAINALRYDARIPGGNDWFGGAEAVAERERLTRVPLVASSIRGRFGAEATLVNQVPWVERDVDGVRILILGLPGAPAAIQSLLHMEEPMAALAAILPDIRKRDLDILVLAAHYPFHPPSDEPSLIQQIARTFPELDVVISAGGGSAVRGARVGEVVCSQADAQGRWLGRVDLTFDTVENALIHRSTDLIKIGPEIPESVELLQALGHRLGRIEHALEQIVGEAKRRVEGSSDWPGQSGIQELVSLSVLRNHEADVVLLGKEGGGYLSDGNILRGDIFRAIPDVQNWARLSLLPSELRDVLAENLAHLGTPDFLGVHGLRYTSEVGTEGNVEIRDLVLDGDRKPHGRGRLRVLCNAALLEPTQPGRERLRKISARPRVRLEILPVDTRHAVIEYLDNHRPVTVRPQRGMTMIAPRVEAQ